MNDEPIINEGDRIEIKDWPGGPKRVRVVKSEPTADGLGREVTITEEVTISLDDLDLDRYEGRLTVENNASEADPQD